MKSNNKNFSGKPQEAAGIGNPEITPLKAPRDKFQSLVQTIDGIIWEADAQTFEFTFVSDQVSHILGFSPEEWLSDPDFWKNHIHPRDREEAINYCHYQTQGSSNHTFDYRMIKADGSVIWIKDMVTVINENGKPKWLRGFMIDITANKRSADLEHLERKILALNAQKDTPIEKVLSMYMQGIEALFPQMQCSILQVRNNRLHNWASASLPKSYEDAIEDLPIGEHAGSCGTAAYLKEKVIVSDIANDPRWADYKHLALPFNLCACWSYPIINAEGIVMAVFGMYYQEIRIPDEEELKVIARSTALLKIILENRQNSAFIQETSLLMSQGQEMAHFGNWQWDIQHNEVSWSDTLYAIYGINKDHFKATFEGYQELLHPGDRERIYNLILDVLKTKKDIVFEERVIRPTGETRLLKSWARVKTDDKGVPVKMIGACLDITESKALQQELEKQNEKLREIAWIQSHIVRAPLARMIGIIDLIKNYQSAALDKHELLSHLLTSAYELDGIIRDIVNKTEQIELKSANFE